MKTLSVVDLAAGTAPLVRGGAAAFASSGNLLAVEAGGGRVIVVNTRDGRLVKVIDAGAVPVRGLALHDEAGVVATGLPGGRIALWEMEGGHVRAVMATGLKELTALAFSPDGKLLAAGDGEGRIVVYQVDPDQEACRISTGKPIRAIALHDSGFPVLTVDSGGRVDVLGRAHKVRPPRELAQAGAAASSLAFPALRSGQPVVALADGVIGKVDPAYRGLVVLARARGGPVRAVWAGSRGQVKALTGDGELCCWGPEDDPSRASRRVLGGLLEDINQVPLWSEDLFSLLSAFRGVRELMRDEAAGELSEKVDRLDGIDDATRTRTRQAVVNSPALIDSRSLSLALDRVWEVNPLPMAALVVAIGLMTVVLPLMVASAALASLHGVGAWLILAGVVIAGLWIMGRAGDWGSAAWTLWTPVMAFGAIIAFAGPKLRWSEPGFIRHLAARWLPAASGVKISLSMPYPVWLGLSYVEYVALVGLGAGLLLSACWRCLSGRAKRKGTPGESLLHALLNVADQAQRMADDAELAASPRERAVLHCLVQTAARVAARDWVTTMRTGTPQADRVIRDQGAAISAAISRWERPAALGGAQLPSLARTTAVAVATAARADWDALAGDTDPAPSLRRRKWRLAGQALSLVVVLGAAAGIGLGIRPLPVVLGPVVTFLVGLAIARILRWLDFSGDIDPGLTLSQLLRKPGDNQ
jgi:hypothetical protein